MEPPPFTDPSQALNWQWVLEKKMLSLKTLLAHLRYNPRTQASVCSYFKFPFQNFLFCALTLAILGGLKFVTWAFWKGLVLSKEFKLINQILAP